MGSKLPSELLIVQQNDMVKGIQLTMKSHSFFKAIAIYQFTPYNTRQFCLVILFTMEKIDMNPLQTRIGTVVAGVILALILAVALKTPNAEGATVYAVNLLEITVWLHAIVGIAWIGLLYYFNAVQVPAVGAALADGEPGPAAINKYVAPRALFWFRWAAVLTWFTGVSALESMGGLAGAFTFAAGWEVIGMGAWLGTIMLFNVWVLIWPNQQKILGLKDASADEIAKAKFVALMASRTNTMLSFPMLLGMTAYGHGLPF